MLKCSHLGEKLPKTRLSGHHLGIARKQGYIPGETAWCAEVATKVGFLDVCNNCLHRERMEPMRAFCCGDNLEPTDLTKLCRVSVGRIKALAWRGNALLEQLKHRRLPLVIPTPHS